MIYEKNNLDLILIISNTSVLENSVSLVVCSNCETKFHGRFCNNCGEKVHNDDEKTVLYFISQIVKSFTITDTKVFRTFKFLFLFPGKLSKEHRAGRKIKYTSPLQLFLFANLLYFIFQPIDIFNTPLSNQSQQLYKGVVETIVSSRLSEVQISIEELGNSYNAVSENVSKLFLIVPVFLFGLVLSLLYFKKKMLYYDHLIFSLHFFSFKIFCFFIMLPYLVGLGYNSLIYFNVDPGKLEFIGTEEFLLIAVLPTLFLYLLLSAKNYYSESWRITSVKCLVLCIAALYIIVFYKFFTFLITMMLI